MNEDQQRFVDVVLEALGDRLEDAEPHDIDFREEFSNDLVEIHFTDGRTLMVKRSPYPEAEERFEVSRVASDLLRKHAGVIAPRHLDLPRRLTDRPVEAYWRIPHATLRRLWPDIADADRAAVLRDCGRLLRRIHRIERPGHGSVLADADDAMTPEAFLEADLRDRLRPAVQEAWPAGRRVVDRLLEAAGEIAVRVRDRRAVLVHNDVWMGNILCAVDDDRIRCVGVLDLEDAFAGPPEADLAKTAVLHGPLFGNHIEGRWFERVWEGYGVAVDPLVLAFFRAYHLVNMGYHAALVGYDAHADEVARSAANEVDALDHTDDSDDAADRL